jgi:hypothetical protein
MIKDLLNIIVNELDVESSFKFVKLNKIMYILLRNKCIIYKKSTNIIKRCYIKYKICPKIFKFVTDASVWRKLSIVNFETKFIDKPI